MNKIKNMLWMKLGNTRKRNRKNRMKEIWILEVIMKEIQKFKMIRMIIEFEYYNIILFIIIKP